MLSSYSWSDYLLIVCVLAGAYYLVIGFIYFRREMKLPFSKTKRSNRDEKKDKESEAIPEGDLSVDELESFASDLRYAILEKAGKNTSKEQLLEQLKQRLANYAGLRKPAYRVAITNYIIRHAQEICGVAFSEEELDEAWKTLLRN